MYSSNALITESVNILIENLPNKFKQLGHIDLILEGGMFNGSYLVGALYFLKEMERRNYIIIDRISGCSIGSIVGFLYYADALDLIASLYTKIKTEFTETCHLNMITNLKAQLHTKIPTDICSYINGKLYICYYNIKKRKKKVKHTYKNIDVLINTLIKSCFIPFVINKSNMCYHKHYIDGIHAHIFKQKSFKKILYIDTICYNTLAYMVNIKNEKNNLHRILYGLLDIHWFFIKEHNTTMCSFVNDWNYLFYLKYNIKYLVEKIIIYTIWILYYFNKYILIHINQHIFTNILSIIFYDIYCFLLKTYCFTEIL